ncbi:pH signal transduction protein PalA [Mucor ambiguus]|uniref:pH signal transduction protein PalA n=1 Tax=Mucor ambiguus TaxID=91626 RepID=A0A0C9MCF8_9FUNG|nr:pH signal transduction protein PalA [Mucor ambiguus]
MLCISSKRTERIVWTPYLREYISNGYAEHPDLYTDDFRVLDELRNDCIYMETNQKALNRLIKYYAQLVFISAKFPIDVGIEFPWYLTFGEGQKPGAVYSQLGNAENRSTTEGIKKACNYFQHAAGCFQLLLDTVVPEMRIAPTIDMSPYALQTLINLMLAQAQECVWQKAAMDQLRDGTIARLALKIAEFYDAACELASNSSISNVYPKPWLIHMHIKALHFNAAAQFRKSCECISQDKYGEEVARLQIASEFVKRAFELKQTKAAIAPSVMNDLRGLQHIISTNLARAEKDNDVIYLESIPLPAALPAILKTQMVKAQAPTEIADPVSLMHDKDLPHPVLGLPLFQKLVPFAVHQAASVYVDRKERLIKEDIIHKLDELNSVYHSSIESLHLPALLATTETSAGLPESIMQQAAEVRSGGGSQALYDMWELVQRASAKNADILEDAFNALDEEHEADEALRSRYTTEWQRPESHILTQQLAAQGQKHRQTLTSAQKADLIVRNKLDTWANIIDVLCLTREELENSIPSSEGSSPSDSLMRIKRLVEDMDANMRLRKDLADQAKKASNADDISPALLKKAAELTAKSPIVKIEAAQFEDLFVDELRKYDTFIMTVDQQDEQQSTILRQLNEAYHQYKARMNDQSSGAKREKALQNLNQAYFKYKEIKTNLTEGLKFYGDHAKGLNTFCDTCRDYCYRRQSESEQIVRKLSLGMDNLSLQDQENHAPQQSNWSRW